MQRAIKRYIAKRLSCRRTRVSSPGRVLNFGSAYSCCNKRTGFTMPRIAGLHLLGESCDGVRDAPKTGRHRHYQIGCGDLCLVEIIKYSL